VDAVVGLIWEQRVVRIPAAGGEGAVAGEEEPVVRVADHAHQEGRHRILIDDAVAELAADLDQASGRVRGTDLEA
jgi:hypothetical protein